jgi:GAF domain-containing protein
MGAAATVVTRRFYTDRRIDAPPAAWQHQVDGTSSVSPADLEPAGPLGARGEQLAQLERALLAELDAARFLRLLVESASRLFRAVCGVWLVGAPGDVLVERITTAPGTFPVEPMAFGEGAAGTCAATRRGLLVNHYPASRFALPRYLPFEIRHSMAQPLLMGDALLGVLSVSRFGEDTEPFTIDEFSSMERLAGFAALALRNARLYDEAVRRRQQAEVLAELGRETTSLDLDRVLAAVVERASPLLGTSGTAVAIRERDGRIRIAAAQGMPDLIKDFAPRHSRDGATARAITERRPIWSSDILEDPSFDLSPSTRAFIGASGLRAVLAVPLLAGERVLGAVLTARDTLGPFTDEQVEVAQAIATHAALALENANLFSLEASRRTQIEALTEVAREIAGELGRERLLRLVAERAGRLFDARGAIFILRGDQLVPEATTDPAVSLPVLPMGSGITGLCAQQRRGMLVNDYASRPEARPGGRRIGVRRLMVQPLLVRDRLLGVIALSRLGDDAEPFRDDDLVSLGRLALQAAVAVRNATLYEEADRRRREAEALAEVARAMSGGPDVGAVSGKIAESLRALFDGHFVGVGLLDRDGRVLIVATVGAAPDTFQAGKALDPALGLVGRALGEQRLCWSSDLLADPSLHFDEERRRLISDGGHRASLVVPLRYGARITGVLGLTWSEPRTFSHDECALVQAFADQAAVALENARLFQEGERRRRQAEALARAGRTLTGVRNVASVGAMIVESAFDLFPGCLAAVRELETDGTLVVAAASPGAAELFPPVVLTPSLGLVGRAVREGRLCWSRDVLNDPLIQVPENRRQHWASAGMVSALAAPLRGRGRTIGVLSLGFSERRDLSEDERALVEAFADQAAIALNNAHLYEDAERRRQEAEVLAGIARTMNSSLEVDLVLQRVVEGARALCRSDIARIALRDPVTRAAMFRYWENTRFTGYEAARLYPGTDSLGGLVLMTGKPHRTDDWMADPRFGKSTAHVVEAEGIITQMIVPIRIGDEIEGLLYVDNRSARPFTDLDEVALVQLAEHASIAIRNAKLFAAVQATGERLQALSSRLLEVQEGERRHIARELHDEVGQALTAVKINLQMLRRQAEGGAVASRLDDSLGMVDRILQGVRRMSLDLRPSLLDDLGLGAALRWYVSAQAERAGLGAEVVAGSLPPDLSPALATTCFRIVQEAVTNVVRHAHASHLTVTLALADGTLDLTIADDGAGFDVAAARRRALAGGSLGLLGIEERAELAGGRSVIESAPRRGTTVRVSLPAGPDRGESPA